MSKPKAKAKTSDPIDQYWKVIVKNYDHILRWYKQFADRRPVMLFDIQEYRVYAYPYREYAADFSKKSQKSLARQYRAALKIGDMVVFIRDNAEQRLVSYSVPILDEP